MRPQVQPMPRWASHWTRDEQIISSAKCQKRTLRSFNHFTGYIKQRCWDRQTERFGRFYIDHKIELGRLLDGQFRWFSALQDTINIMRRLCKPSSKISAV